MKKSHKFKFSKEAEREYTAVQSQIEQVWVLVRKARYKKAFDLAKATVRLHPKNRFAAYNFAVALGDSREWVSELQHRKNQAKAAALL